jgi:hypothetical protein
MPDLKYTEMVDNKPVNKAFKMSEIINKENNCIMSGMLSNFDMSPAYSMYSHITPSRHLTIVFNMFVWL